MEIEKHKKPWPNRTGFSLSPEGSCMSTHSDDHRSVHVIQRTASFHIGRNYCIRRTELLFLDEPRGLAQRLLDVDDHGFQGGRDGFGSWLVAFGKSGRCGPRMSTLPSSVIRSDHSETGVMQAPGLSNVIQRHTWFMT